MGLSTAETQFRCAQRCQLESGAVMPMASDLAGTPVFGLAVQAPSVRASRTSASTASAPPISMSAESDL
jgi:hypothetical protein